MAARTGTAKSACVCVLFGCAVSCRFGRVKNTTKKNNGYVGVREW